MFAGDTITPEIMLLITFVSMGIVFGALILLTFILGLFKITFYKEKKSNKELVKVAPVNEVVADNDNDEDEEELIAVITAAIASSMSTSIDNIVIRNIRRVPQTTAVWGRMGRQEQVNK